MRGANKAGNGEEETDERAYRLDARRIRTDESGARTLRRSGRGPRPPLYLDRSGKPGITPTGTASICSCTGMWRRAGSWCRYEGILPTLSLSRYSQRESRRWRRSTSASARNSVMALVGDAVELLL